MRKMSAFGWYRVGSAVLQGAIVVAAIFAATSRNWLALVALAVLFCVVAFADGFIRAAIRDGQSQRRSRL